MADARPHFLLTEGARFLETALRRAERACDALDVRRAAQREGRIALARQDLRRRRRVGHAGHDVASRGRRHLSNARTVRARPAVSQVAWLVPQKQVVTSPDRLQFPERMQAEAVWHSARPVASVMPQQPSVAGFRFAFKHVVQDATRAAGGLVSMQAMPPVPPVPPVPVVPPRAARGRGAARARSARRAGGAARPAVPPCPRAGRAAARRAGAAAGRTPAAPAVPRDAVDRDRVGRRVTADTVGHRDRELRRADRRAAEGRRRGVRAERADGGRVRRPGVRERVAGIELRRNDADRDRRAARPSPAATSR